MAPSDMDARLSTVETNVAVLTREVQHIAGDISEIRGRNKTTEEAVHEIKSANAVNAWKMGAVIGLITALGIALLNALGKKLVGP